VSGGIPARLRFVVSGPAQANGRQAMVAVTLVAGMLPSSGGLAPPLGAVVSIASGEGKIAMARLFSIRDYGAGRLYLGLEGEFDLPLVPGTTIAFPPSDPSGDAS
jgi:hypothetical protein